jgi:hypothetical protein
LPIADYQNQDREAGGIRASTSRRHYALNRQLAIGNIRKSVDLLSGHHWNSFQITPITQLTKAMLFSRIYVAALTVTFLCITLFTRGVGPLEGIVIVCPLLFMILDMQIEMREFSELERRVIKYLVKP